MYSNIANVGGMACRVSPHRKQHLCLFQVEFCFQVKLFVWICEYMIGLRYSVQGLGGKKWRCCCQVQYANYIYRRQQQHLCWFKVQCVREREKRETKRKKEKEKTREEDREREGMQGEGQHLLCRTTSSTRQRLTDALHLLALYVYIYIVCVCVCVWLSVCARDRVCVRHRVCVWDIGCVCET